MKDSLPQQEGVTIKWFYSPLFGRHFSLRQPELWFLCPTTEAREAYYDSNSLSLLPPNWKRIQEDLNVRASTFRRFILLTILFKPFNLFRKDLARKIESMIPLELRVNLQWSPDYEDKEEDINNKILRNQSQDDLIVCSLLLSIVQEIFKDPEWNPDHYERHMIFQLLKVVGIDQKALIREYGQLSKDHQGMLLAFNKSKFHIPPRKKVQKPRRRRSSEDRSGSQRISHSGVPIEVRKQYQTYEEIFLESLHPLEYRRQTFSIYKPKPDESESVTVKPIGGNPYFNIWGKQWRKRLAGNAPPTFSGENTRERNDYE